MPELVVGGVPTNMRLPVGGHGAQVDSDLYGICERLREYDPNVRVTLLTQDALFAWSVGEVGPDGVLREILRTKELDGRIIDRLNYIRSVPVEERVKAIEADYDRERAAREEHESEDLYDKIGGGIYDNLFRCGFSHQPKPMSVRPLNRAARRAGRRAR